MEDAYGVSEWLDDRGPLLPLFALADDSPEQVSGYLGSGRVWVARAPDGAVVGHVQAIPRDDRVWEVSSTAVLETARRRGVGSALARTAVEAARAQGIGRLVVATATCDVANLAFHQRCGYRMTHVVRDVFTPANGYPESVVDGIELRDQIWFDQML
ncbi:GNAT family N-acetyltransferase [Nocardioides yefusunii]|uniref:GNAT family N-acetyltransferase n=1 Tax=Nocardioides yefusunii TaxID=2500546 RepID=A0ABW1QVH8_9ACTN|nr:GNAT family N-acetyltransferase [Nocardioides yefusunii]